MVKKQQPWPPHGLRSSRLSFACFCYSCCRNVCLIPQYHYGKLFVSFPSQVIGNPTKDGLKEDGFAFLTSQEAERQAMQSQCCVAHRDSRDRLFLSFCSVCSECLLSPTGSSPPGSKVAASLPGRKDREESRGGSGATEERGHS